MPGFGLQPSRDQKVSHPAPGAERTAGPITLAELPTATNTGGRGRVYRLKHAFFGSQNMAFAIAPMLRAAAQ